MENQKTLPNNDLSRSVVRALEANAHHLEAAQKICVVIPDATRPLPFEATLTPLLERLSHGGHSVIVLVALGLHRPMTTAELAPVERAIDGTGAQLVQHAARGTDIVALGAAGGLPQSAPTELPIALNRHVVDADRVLCIGTVEPHQYAGYSGGIKAISIGCAGGETIAAMHGLSFLRDPNTTLGAIDNNPFQTALWQIGDCLDGVLGLQIVPAADGGVADLFFGPLRSAFLKACDMASELFFQTFKTPVDWLHLPVPSVKATNFYQASRAATYAALVDRPALHPGAAILIEAPCTELMGTGEGEQACELAMRRGKEQLLQELGGDEPTQTQGGQQRAYILARTCQQFRLALVGAPPIAALAPMGIDQFDTVSEAKTQLGLQEDKGQKIDDIFHRVPRLGAPGNKA